METKNHRTPFNRKPTFLLIGVSFLNKIMENKYYTPDISEFHVGFEYEFNDIGTDSENIYNEWQKASIKDGTQIDDITRKENEQVVYDLRVKLLNREDIEGMGWGFNHQCKSSKDELVITYWHPDKQCMLMFYTDKKFIIMEKLSKTHHSVMLRIFRGFVKNKSELQKLLIQLDIK